MHNDYFIRCRQADVPQLYALAVALGVLAPIIDAEGRPTSEYGIAPGRLGAWAVDGTIHRPTGAMLATDMGKAPELVPVLDADGQPYWHANLRIDIELADRARELAPTNPAIAAGLADLARWFVVGEDGRAAAPREPAQVWL